MIYLFLKVTPPFLGINFHLNVFKMDFIVKCEIFVNRWDKVTSVHQIMESDIPVLIPWAQTP